MTSRLFYFGLSVVLLGVTALASIPFMIAASGIHAWSSIAIGQAVGSVCYIVVLWGWGITGPAAIAVSPPPERRTRYFDSLRARSLLAIPTLVLGVGVAMLSTRGNIGLAALGVLSTGLLGLCGNWYFTGTGQSRVLFLLESLPRALGTAVGTAVMTLWSFPAHVSLLGTVFGAVMAIVIESVYVHQRVSPGRAIRADRSVALLRAQRPAASVGMVGAAYVSLPVVIVAYVSHGALPVFAVLDKIQKQSVTAMGPVFNVLQGWVPKVPAEVRQRASWAVQISAGIGAANVLGYIIFGEFVVELIANSSVEVTGPQILATGLAGSLYIFDAVIGRAVLVPLGMMTVLRQSTWAGTLVGLVAVAVLAELFGAEGAMFGFCFGLGVKIVWGLAVVAASDRR